MKRVASRVTVLARLCAITLSSLSSIFFGHFFLKIAPRFSGAGAPGSVFVRCRFAGGSLVPLIAASRATEEELGAAYE